MCSKKFKVDLCGRRLIQVGVDSSEGTPSGNLINSEEIIDLLSLLSGDPIRLIDEQDTRYTINAFVRYAIEQVFKMLVAGWSTR